MNLLVLLASASVFFILQAVYWFVVSRRGARSAVLAARLGTDESAADMDGIMRGGVDQEGAVAQLLTRMLEEAGEEPDTGPLFVRVGIAFFLSFTLLLMVSGDPGVALLLGLLGCMLPFLWLIRKKAKRMARIEMQLPEALEVMTISLRAGQSLDQTIRLTASELDAPIGDEFQRVAEEAQLGRPLEEALVAMSARLPTSRTVRTFVVSVLVLRQTGGNLIEVLESIIDTMRAQAQYQRKLMAMTAEGRSSARMLAALPPGFVLMASLANEGYISALFDDPVGQKLLTAAITLYVIGVLWVRRLTKPKV